MSGIRKTDASQKAMDVEAPAPKDVPHKAFAAPPGAPHNPVFLAKMICRKVITLLLISNDDDITRPAGIITMFRDIVIGIIFGVMFISLSIFLDHHNVIHLQSAHNFRNAAFNMLNDPETIANLEESSDMKFLLMMDYDNMREEIDGVEEKLKWHRELYEKKKKQGDEQTKEMAEVRPLHEKLINDEGYKKHLEEWCGSCKWGQTNCDKRVEYLVNTYMLGKLASQASLVRQGHCKKQG